MGMKFFTSPLYIAILGVGVVVVILLIRAIMKLNKRPNKKAKDKATKGNFIDVTINPNAVLTPLKIQNEEKLKPPEPMEVISKKGVINARIYDVQHRARYLRHIDLIPGKDYGRQWLCGKDYVFALQKDGDVLTPREAPRSMEHPPSELYEALQTKDDVAEVLGNRSDDDNKMKWGLLVFGACVALFIAFMAIYKKGGG